MPRKLELPARSTRGNRLDKLLQEQAVEDDAQEDLEFWNQEFFQEEQVDRGYHTESSRSDVFSSDFLDTEESSDEEAGGDVDKPRRLKVKPPSYKRRRRPTAKAAAKRRAAAVAAAGEDGDKVVPARRKPTAPRADQPGYEAPSLRHSTRVRVQEAATKRQQAENTRKPRRRAVAEDVRPLTQEELLAEAARTEIENTKSLQLLVAREEESKAKAAADKAQYTGPRLRYLSQRNGDTARTVFELVDCPGWPPNLQRRVAPDYPRPQLCVVTGAPARYRDPLSGLPYATTAAFKELRRRLTANPHQAARGVRRSG